MGWLIICNWLISEIGFDYTKIVKNTSLQRQSAAVFDFIHHEGALDGTQALDGAQGVDEKVIVIQHIRRVNLEEVVKISGDVVTFGHFRDVLDPVHKIVGNVFPHSSETHAAKDQETPAQLGGVQDGRIFADVALILQPVQALEDGGGRDSNSRPRR